MLRKKPINLLLGPSSSGKSYFLNKKPHKNCKILMAYELDDNPIPNEEVVIHYNSFRPFKNSFETCDAPFQSDEVLQKIVDSSRKLQVTILVVSQSNLIKRAILRKYLEPKLRGDREKYPNNNIITLLHKIDLIEHYRLWINFFENFKIKINLIDSNNKYKTIRNREDLELAHSASHSEYSYTEIKSVLKNYRFEYHSIELPHGLSTPGTKREYSLLRQFNFKGKSVLDVGCGYGALCHFAENSGASKVVGTELKKHRFLGSVILKNILSSNTHFLDKDILEVSLESRFDYVFLMNVIHHLTEPFKAIRRLCEYTKNVLVIEFPNLSDPKFLSTLPKGSIIPQNLPLIGISTVSEDQTFLLSRPALERFMNEHHPEFSLEFHPSEVSNTREVMIARKNI